jgi:hypothetical protein
VQFQYLLPIEANLGKTRRSTVNTEVLKKKEKFESKELEAVIHYEPEAALYGEEKLERIPCDTVRFFLEDYFLILFPHHWSSRF